MKEFIFDIQRFETINSSADNVTLTGSEDGDDITNTGSYVTINALGGNDTIDNTDNNKTYIDAGDGDDYITNELFYEVVRPEGATLDVLQNYYSDTTIVAGTGDDTIDLTGGYNLSVMAGDGDDIIWTHHSYYKTVDGGAGNDLIEITEGHHENLFGGDGDDTIIGTILFKEIRGDWAMGGYANIDGGAGADYISVGYSNDATIKGGDGDDTITAYGTNSQIYGGDGNDSIALISNNETTLNSAGTTISGGAGDDTITGDGSGIVYRYAQGDGNDVILGLTDNDTLIIDGDSYYKSTVGSDLVVSIVGAKNTITLKDAASLSPNFQGTEHPGYFDKSGNEVHNPVAMIASGDATYYYESVARATNDADNNSTVTVIEDSTETATINATKNLTIQFAESGLGVYNVSGGNFVSADTSTAAQFSISSNRILSNANSLLINSGRTATLDGYAVTANSNGYTFALQENPFTLNNVSYSGAGTANFNLSGNVTLTSGAIVDDSNFATSSTGIVLAAGTYTINGDTFSTNSTTTIYYSEENVHFALTSGNSITYNDIVFGGVGGVSIAGGIPTLTAGVSATRPERVMVVLTERGYNTLDGRGFQLTENVSDGVTVGAIDDGIGAAHIVSAEDFPEDAGKLFAEEALIYGDDSYTVRIDHEGIRSIYGISSGATVRGTAYLDGEVDPFGSILNLALDGAGTYTFSDKTYNVAGTPINDSVAIAMTSRFYNDGSSSLRAVHYLNGTVSGDFSNGVTVNNTVSGAREVKVEGDNVISVVADASGATAVKGLSNGASLSGAGGATIASTDEEGTFNFQSDNVQTFTVRGDNSVDFNIRNYKDTNGNSKIQVNGITNLENGTLIINDATTSTKINSASSNDELSMAFTDTATFVIADSKVVSVDGIEGAISNLKGDATVHATQAITVDSVYANVTGDSDFNVIVADAKTTGLSNISAGASVSVSNVDVVTDNNGDFTVGEYVYSLNDSDERVTLTTDENGAVKNIIGLVGTLKTNAKNVTLNGDALETSNTDITITSAQGSSNANDTYISRVDGLVSGDSISGVFDNADIAMPGNSSTDTSTITINSRSYKLTGDEDGVTFVGVSRGNATVSAYILGLDSDASLQFSTAGNYFVNGVYLTVKAGDVAIGTAENSAYIYDPNNLPLNPDDMTTEEISAQVGISTEYTSVETSTAMANALVENGGDLLNGNMALALDNAAGIVPQTADFSNTTGRKKVTLSGGDQNVVFNNANGNVAVVDATSEGEKNVNLGNGAGLVIVNGNNSSVNISAGNGNSTVVASGDNISVNLGGGATKIVASSGNVNLNNYNPDTGAGIQTNEYTDISRAIASGNINLGDGQISFGNATVYLGDENTDSTTINLFNNQGDRQKVAYTNLDGGNLDLSGERENMLLVGNNTGGKGSANLRGGNGDDTAIGGAGDYFDLGSGNNYISIGERRYHDDGATIALTAANSYTEVDGFNVGYEGTSDKIQLNVSNAQVSFKDGRVTFNLNGGGKLILNVGLASSADLIDDDNFVNGTTLDDITPINYEQGDYQFGNAQDTLSSDLQLAFAQG